MFKRLRDAIPETPTTTNPILERLAQWIIPAELPATGAIATIDCAAVSAWPDEGNHSDLLAFSLFTRAIGLHRIGTPEAHRRGPVSPHPTAIGKPGAFPRQPRAAPNRPLGSRIRRRRARLLDSPDPPRNRHLAASCKARPRFTEARAAYRRWRQGPGHSPCSRKPPARSPAMKRIPPASMPRIVRLTDSTGNRPADRRNRPSRRVGTSPPISNSNAPSPRPIPPRNAPPSRTSSPRHPDHPRMPEARLAAAEAALIGRQARPFLRPRPIGNPRRRSGKIRSPPIRRASPCSSSASRISPATPPPPSPAPARCSMNSPPTRRRRSRPDPRPQPLPNPQLQRRAPRARKTRRLRHRSRPRPGRVAARRPLRRPRPHRPVPAGGAHPLRQGDRDPRDRSPRSPSSKKPGS